MKDLIVRVIGLVMVFGGAASLLLLEKNSFVLQELPLFVKIAVVSMIAFVTVFGVPVCLCGVAPFNALFNLWRERLKKKIE